MSKLDQKFLDDINNHDGVIRRFTTNGGEYDEMVVRDPNQIKSATENNGDFSRDNNDIRFSLAEPDDRPRSIFDRAGEVADRYLQSRGQQPRFSVVNNERTGEGAIQLRTKEQEKQIQHERAFFLRKELEKLGHPEFDPTFTLSFADLLLAKGLRGRGAGAVSYKFSFS